MSGAFGFVQKLIQDKQPLAVYAHCAAHNLNLVNDAVSASCEVGLHVFFTTMQELHAFFGHGVRRWELVSFITLANQQSHVIRN